MVCERGSDKWFYGASAVVFAASTVATILWCRSMSAMGGDMLMPGGWTMPMTWMRMPGQTWVGMASSFIGMWAVMMAAMMLPSLVPMLRRYREAAGGAGARWLGARTVLVGVGYFFVWTLIGMAVFPVGVGVGVAEMLHPGLSRAVPVAVGVLVVLVGALQLTAWKARVLACCRADQPIGALPTGVTAAWRHGLRLGVACARGCVGLMVLLVVLGVMDLRVMAVVAVGVTAERLAPAGDRVARGIGWVVIGAGAFLVARSVGLG